VQRPSSANSAASSSVARTSRTSGTPRRCWSTTLISCSRVGTVGTGTRTSEIHLLSPRCGGRARRLYRPRFSTRAGGVYPGALSPGHHRRSSPHGRRGTRHARAAGRDRPSAGGFLQGRAEVLGLFGGEFDDQPAAALQRYPHHEAPALLRHLEGTISGPGL